MLLTLPAALVSGAETVAVGEVRLRDVDATGHVHQLVADGLPSDVLPVRADAGGSRPLRTLADVRAEARRAVADASDGLEARIEEDVARRISRALRRVGPPPG